MVSTSSSSNAADEGTSNDNNQNVTLSSMILLGGTVFTGAAAVVGTVHWHSTAKQLKEEGIPLSARQRALPLATKALVSSTIGCIIVGGMAAVAFTSFGGEYKGSTALGSFSSVMALVREQRDLIRQHFQQTMSGNIDTSMGQGITDDVKK